jgi:hypothetical protein
MMETPRTSETLVNFYQTTRCYNPEDSNLHTHRRENLKSYLYLKCFNDDALHKTILTLMVLENPRSCIGKCNIPSSSSRGSHVVRSCDENLTQNFFMMNLCCFYCGCQYLHVSLLQNHLLSKKHITNCPCENIPLLNKYPLILKTGLELY